MLIVLLIMLLIMIKICFKQELLMSYLFVSGFLYSETKKMPPILYSPRYRTREDCYCCHSCSYTEMFSDIRKWTLYIHIWGITRNTIHYFFYIWHICNIAVCEEYHDNTNLCDISKPIFNVSLYYHVKQNYLLDI